MTKDVFSTHQVAKFCKVHLTTIINWVNDGTLNAYTTPGGHRRIKKEDMIKFMMDFKIPIPKEIAQDIKRILIIDDDIEMLEELEEALKSKKFKIELALNGFEAGRKIYRRKPDLILLDFKMPGMDGFQVCELLKKDEETENITIIAVTALNMEEDIKKIKKCGVKKIIHKPVDISKLKKIINESV